MFKKRRIAIASLFIVIGVIIGLAISSNFNFSSQGYTEDKMAKKGQMK
jgi:hypothetical protein